MGREGDLGLNPQEKVEEEPEVVEFRSLYEVEGKTRDYVLKGGNVSRSQQSTALNANHSKKKDK